MTEISVSVAKVAELLDLKNYTSDMDLKKRKIHSADVNRPALQLCGYFDHFEQSRVQIIGNVEDSYIKLLSEEEQKERYSEFMKYDIPCIIFCRDIEPDEMLIRIGEENNVPILGTDRPTSEFMAELINTLGEQLAPCITVHGVLVDVYGEGIMITGESGIGKSEAALELIRRGHRLITDDVVQIDLVIKLEDWKKDADYDRLGLEEEYIEYLGNKVVCHSLPIRPGRNLAVICEAAAVNHRQKKMGYNAAQELYRRVQANITKQSSDEDDE